MAFETPPRWAAVLTYLLMCVVGIVVALSFANIWLRVLGWIIFAYGAVCFIVTCSWGRFIPVRRASGIADKADVTD